MTRILITTTRLAGLILIVLGGLFWGGQALNLIPLHMLIGLIFVIALWTLAIVSLAAARRRPLALFAVLWGVLVLFFGMLQASMLPGGAHWLIQVLHLLIGLIGIGLAEMVAGRRTATQR